MANTDPFEDVLNLEDQLYQEGHAQGVEDGAQAGKIEGRALGLERGYAKFLEAGRLYGRSLVWGSRLPLGGGQTGVSTSAGTSSGGEVPESGSEPQTLPALPGNPRLQKNIATLHALVEPDTLSTDNTDEAVNDFDDRIKRAQGKAKVVEKIIGDQVPKAAPASNPTTAAV